MNFMRITPARIIMAVVAVVVLVSMGLTIAASRNSSSKPSQVPGSTVFPTKTVPDVVGQPYVFAESMLQAHGFGWQVKGRVAGWADALVITQSPAANTVVVDTGAPLVVLQLAKPSGTQTGTPVNSSPYAGTKIVYPLTSPNRVSGETPTTGVTTTTPTTTTKPTTRTTPTTTTKPTPVTTRPISKSKPSRASSRPRAFMIAGAKSEPLDELPLPVRAKKLNTWLDSHRRVSAANVRYWLIQHAWIVDGAEFGWWHGAQALETLIAVDKRVEALWGVGSRSETEAEAALAFVHAHGG